MLVDAESGPLSDCKPGRDNCIERRTGVTAEFETGMCAVLVQGTFS